MPAKAPMYLKSNGSKSPNGSGGKKLRELISSDMISLPIGDFRHVAHVGRGADDMFGDTTFLNEKNANSTATGSNASAEKQDGSLKSLRKNSKGSKKQRNNSVPEGSEMKPEVKSLSNQSCEGYGPLQSPILQSAFSLPLLHQENVSTPTTTEEYDIEKVKQTKTTMNNNHISNGKAISHEDGLDKIMSTPSGTTYGPPKPRRIPVEEEVSSKGDIISKATLKNNPSASQSSSEKSIPNLPSETTSIDEGWSLELDLGTSLMDDVMGIMEKIEL